MSVAFQRVKMRFTRAAVDHVRVVVDSANSAIGTITGPFNEFVGKMTNDAPWLAFVLASGAFMACPLLAYPWIKRWLLADPREARERERVRLCLQKGIDPFPTIQHKDYTFGNLAPSMQSNSDSSPVEASWEYQAMQRYFDAKKKLRSEFGDNETAPHDVAKMLRLKEELALVSQDMSKVPIGWEPKSLTFTDRKDVNVMKS